MPIQTARLDFLWDNTEGRPVATITTPDGVATIPLTPMVNMTGMAQHHVGMYVANPEPKLKKYSAKKNKRRSIAQELDVMEELGGQRHAGSGARAGLKGDGKVRGKYRVEVKNTRKEGFRLTRKDLDKIRGECVGLEQPLYVVGFMDPETGGSEDRWVLVPFEAFVKLDKENAAHLIGRPTTTG